MQIQTFDQVVKLLSTYIPRKNPGAYSLDLMNRLMAQLDYPQNSYKVVHIAGTSGKTSTAYYVADLLKQTGNKVGLTVSPHVDQINERVQINLVPLPEMQFCSEITSFLEIVNKLSIKPSYFEFMAAFAFWEFARQKVDYAVIEVGLGGLLDGTNVIDRPDKVCLITDIGLDHTQVLGNTISSIATQKAGIIQPHNTVFCYDQNPTVTGIIKSKSAEQKAEVHIVRPGQLKGDIPLFQERNLNLALQTVEYITQRDSLTALTDEMVNKVKSIVIPARMERIIVGDKIVIIDGSHNVQKISKLVESFNYLYPNQEAAVLMTVIQDKSVVLDDIMTLLAPITSALIVTEFSSQQDLPKKSVAGETIIASAEKVGIRSSILEKDPAKAFKLLIDSNQSVLLVTGSFYLLNFIRPLVFNSKHD